MERFTRLGVDLAVSTPEEFDALVKSDTEQFTKLFGKARNRGSRPSHWAHDRFPKGIVPGSAAMPPFCRPGERLEKVNGIV